MLGEKHSLNHDFPEYSALINALCQEDQHFAQENKAYNAIDREIRTLELNKMPIDDLSMSQLKHRRSEMKDRLYKILKEHPFASH